MFHCGLFCLKAMLFCCCCCYFVFVVNYKLWLLLHFSLNCQYVNLSWWQSFIYAFRTTFSFNFRHFICKCWIKAHKCIHKNKLVVTIFVTMFFTHPIIGPKQKQTDFFYIHTSSLILIQACVQSGTVASVNLLLRGGRKVEGINATESS